LGDLFRPKAKCRKPLCSKRICVKSLVDRGLQQEGPHNEHRSASLSLDPAVTITYTENRERSELKKLAYPSIFFHTFCATLGERPQKPRIGAMAELAPCIRQCVKSLRIVSNTGHQPSHGCEVALVSENLNCRPDCREYGEMVDPFRKSKRSNHVL